MVSVNKWRGGGQLLMDECSVEMNILWRDWENPLLKLFLREETKRAVLTNLIPALDDSPPLKG